LSEGRAQPRGTDRRSAPQPSTAAPGSQWLGFNGGYDATRFSSLKQINTGNIATIREVARTLGTRSPRGDGGVSAVGTRGPTLCGLVQ
jgi:glucose dehydrogenase